MLTRNDERVGVASGVEFKSDGIVFIDNFLIPPEFNGRGIATIFNEEILRTARLHMIHVLHTAVTIPVRSNAYAVEKVGFVRAVSQSKYAKMITKDTGLGYDADWGPGKKEYLVGAFYIYPLKQQSARL